MKKILLLAALASTSFSGVAMAGFCASQPEYNVTVAGSCAGSATFAPTSVAAPSYSGIYGGQSSCGYAMEWKNPVADAATPSASCNVAQVSTLGQGTCGADAKEQTAFAAPILSVSGCQGFDTSGIVQTVSFMLSAGGEGCSMNGLAIYSFFPYQVEPITFN